MQISSRKEDIRLARTHTRCLRATADLRDASVAFIHGEAVRFRAHISFKTKVRLIKPSRTQVNFSAPFPVFTRLHNNSAELASVLAELALPPRRPWRKMFA